MKYENRQPYRELINMMPAGYGLCNFCKLAQWEGMSCCDSELKCQHGLVDRYTFPDPYDVWQGADCWGFRPSDSLQTLGVAVSISYKVK